MIALLLAALAMVAGCRPEPRHAAPPHAPPPNARPSPGTADTAPAPAARDEARPPEDRLTWEGVAIQDELGLLPNLRLGTVRVASGIDLTAVVDRLRAKLPVLRGCLRREVTPRPASPLTLTLSFAFDRAGQVGAAELGGTGFLALRQCMASALMGTRGFPPGPVQVEASLVVTPVRSTGGTGR